MNTARHADKCVCVCDHQGPEYVCVYMSQGFASLIEDRLINILMNYLETS